MSNEPEQLKAGKRPYYDPSVLSNKRKAEKSVLIDALKVAFGFGKAIVKRPSDEVMKQIKG